MGLGCGCVSAESQRGERKHACVVVAARVGGWASV